MRFKVMDVLKLGIQMVEQIRALHHMGFIHGDIRPNNYVIEPDRVHSQKIVSEEALAEDEERDQAMRDKLMM
jgi:tRNA A-37 threonylcarbamoyl transferase component Bud32